MNNEARKFRISKSHQGGGKVSMKNILTSVSKTENNRLKDLQGRAFMNLGYVDNGKSLETQRFTLVDRDKPNHTCL